MDKAIFDTMLESDANRVLYLDGRRVDDWNTDYTEETGDTDVVLTAWTFEYQGVNEFGDGTLFEFKRHEYRFTKAAWLEAEIENDDPYVVLVRNTDGKDVIFEMDYTYNARWDGEE